MVTRRFFDALLSGRLRSTAAVLLASAPLLFFAGRLRTDASVDQMFPVHDPVRAIYDRYKERFPFEDARALLIVEGPDLWTRADPLGAKRCYAPTDMPGMP